MFNVRPRLGVEALKHNEHPVLSGFCAPRTTNYVRVAVRRGPGSRVDHIKHEGQLGRSDAPP